MKDWGPVIVGLILFILLSPGVVFQLPGNQRRVQFGGLTTNGKSIVVHTLIFFAVYTILILAVPVRIFFGKS